jgi:hypothetical protein
MFKQRLRRILENNTVVREYLDGRPISGVLPVDKEHRKLLLDRAGNPQPFMAVNSDTITLYEESDNRAAYKEALSILIFHQRDDVQSYMVVGELLQLFHPNSEVKLNYKDDGNPAKVYAITNVVVNTDQWNALFDCGMHILTLEVLFGYDNL